MAPVPLTPEMWDRVADAFGEAVAVPADQRLDVLRQTLGDDPRLLAEAEDMLRAHENEVPMAVEARLVVEASSEGSLLPGTRVGPYRIEALIGEGGMGEVYRAERVDGDFRQVVALKVVRAGLRSAEFIRRFRLERQILLRLAHPGIVTILDGGATDDGRPYLVMPFVEGEPVTDYCARVALGLPERIRLLRQIAEILQYAHGRLVVHRDLKPSNILVSDGCNVRLLDFGIAKLLDDEADSGPYTRSLMRLLTPAYAAPEQIRGDVVTTATDVYALGVLAFELLSGRQLVQRDGRPHSEVERSVLEDAAPPPSTVASGYPWARKLRGDLDRIVLMALRKEPERRYASAGAFSEDLEQYLAGRPVRAERDTAWYRLRKFAVRNRTLVSLGSAVVVLLAVLAVSSTIQARRVARERDRAEREKTSAESVVGLLTGLFDKANPALDPAGDTMRIRDVLADGARRVDSLTSEPAVQSRLWRTLGSMQLARGRPAEAVRLYQRAYDQMITTPGSDSGDVARVSHEIARATRNFRGNDASLPLFRLSVARLTRMFGDTATDVRRARMDLALATDDDRERREILDDLLRIEETSPVPDSLARASALNAQAGERLARGEYSDGLTQYLASLHIVERLLPPEHPIRMAVMSNAITAKLLLGDFSSADTLTRELLRLRRAAVAPDSNGLAKTLDRWGVVRAHLVDYVEGERALRESLEIERRILAPGHQRIESTLRNLAYVVGSTGRIADGMELLDSARHRAQARPDGHSFAAQMLAERAMFLLQLDRTDEARRDLRAAEITIRGSTPPDHPSRADLETQLGILALFDQHADSAQRHFETALAQHIRRLPADHPLVVGVRCGIGVALARQRKTREAEPWLRPACSRYAQAGVRMAWLSDEGQRTLDALRRP